MKFRRGEERKVLLHFGLGSSVLSTFFGVILTAFALSGCMVNKTGSPASSNGSKGSGGLVNGLNTSGPAINISSMVQTPGATSSSIDLYSSDNSLGTYCHTPVGSAPTVTGCQSSCSCYFQYTQSGLPNSSTVTPSLCQLNMVRCPTNSLPSGITGVYVQVKAGSNYSTANSISALGSNDPSLLSAYSKVQRYMCRPIINVPYLFDGNQVQGGGMYDPLQSEDPILTFPINLYTTNPGKTVRDLISISSTNGLQWDCSLNPADPVFWKNMSIYSEATLAATGMADTRISDELGSDNQRNLFYVAKQSGGIFTAPVYALTLPPNYIAGSSATLPNGDTLPPLGFGAYSDSAGNCSAPVPVNGTQWVKLFNFKGNIPTGNYIARTAGSSQNSGMSSSTVSQIACNVGGNFVSTDCSAGTKGSYASGGSPGVGGLNVSGYSAPNILAARLISTRTATANTQPACIDMNSSTSSSWLPGGSGHDTWVRVGADNGTAVPVATSSVLNGLSPAPTPGSPWTAHDVVYVKQSGSTTATLDAHQNYAPPVGSDFIFVVTPNSVPKGWSRSNYPLYVPSRFSRIGDCLINGLPAKDPSQCPGSYGHLKMTYNGPIANFSNNVNSTTEINYPICVLQPTTAGLLP